MSQRRRQALLGGLLAAVLVAGVLVLALRGDGATPDGQVPAPVSSELPSGDPTEGSSTTAEPSAGTSEPEPTASPAPGPTAPEPVPAEDDPAEAPVAIDEAAPFATGVAARLVQIEPIQGEAEGPGEIAGPALRITVELSNPTDVDVSLAATVVNVYAGPGRAPSTPLSGPGAAEFEGSLPAGSTETAVYVFAVAEDVRDDVQVTVSYDPDVAMVVFEGAAPR